MSERSTQVSDRVAALRSWHDDWSGLRVAVLGLGMTGFSVADTLVELGSRVRVIYGGEDPDRERLLFGATMRRVPTSSSLPPSSWLCRRAIAPTTR